MLLDVVEFTTACSKMTAPEVLCWMRSVRRAIEEELVAHDLRLIETRGDNYLAVTTEADGPLPAARAVLFGASAARAVRMVNDTRVRVGIARGPMTVARLDCILGRRGVLCAFGDVVNVAGRLEQSGGPDFVHLSEEVAVAFAAEQGLAPPSVGCFAAKGKPAGIRSARWNWRRQEFEAASPAAAAAIAATALWKTAEGIDSLSKQATLDLWGGP
jgi:class 3 adenylate cyclase